MTTPSHLEVTSKDGTAVGATVDGRGPSLLLVYGSTADHTRWAPLVPQLRDEFRLVMVDRRGRSVSVYREALRFDEAAIAALRPLPMWQARVAAVHTVVRECEAVRRFQPPHVHPQIPVRILLFEVTAPHLVASTRAAAAALDGSELAILPGQGHVAIDTAADEIARHVRETWELARS